MNTINKQEPVSANECRDCWETKYVESENQVKEIMITEKRKRQLKNKKIHI